ncbi:MAG: hypothetical protein ABI729_00595 [Chitinophagales bacterium]
MLTTIKGVYNHGKITLAEPPPVETKTDVMVTFLPSGEKTVQKGKQKIILGMLDGKINLPDDFNEPLEDLKEYM